ncbi:putative small subunit of serine palmitoyltransferase [Helianthus annuus]|nr:putative small subunit of serine palmitoyltransferase [Helianthus annuus]
MPFFYNFDIFLLCFCVCRFNIMSRNWAQRKIYLYNVTFGLYMLDPWERYLFNAVVAVLMWFIFYNGYRNLDEICKRYIW